MVTNKFVTNPYSNAKEVQQAGYRCINHIKEHFASRPKPTGIARHEYRPSDTIVTTFPKSGTTLLQHMAYQIVALSGGGPSFDRTGSEFSDLSVVSPWIEFIPQIGNKPCETTPRIFKTHAPVTAFSAHDCQHIVVVRDPTAYPSSWLDFVFNAFVPNAADLGDDVREAAFHACVEMDLLTPCDDAAAALGQWHTFVKSSVLPLRENVLVLFYENIVADITGTVRTVASFIDCSLTDDAVHEVVKRCDRSTMANDSRFFCRIENKCFGVGVDVPKAKKARQDGFRRFRVKEENVKALEDMNMRTFGVRTYQEFRDLVIKKQWEMFHR